MFKFFATDSWYKKAAKAEADHEVVVVQPVAEEEAGTTYKVPYTTILNITPHNNADKLEIAWVYGFQVVVKKDMYKVGDKVVYVPIDSILPQWLEDRLFPADAKIKLNKHRVRQIRIRKLASQGMLVSLSDVSDKISSPADEQDLKSVLGITKYEPPAPAFQGPAGPKNRNKKHEHPMFHKYNGLDNIKWFPDLFKEGETEVVIQEKLHGTNARASKLPYIANTWKKKLKKFFGLAPKVELCYGSNNVDISAATSYTGFYGEDIYGKCFDSINVFEKIKLGEIVYGEIIGPSVQKNYEYGLREHHFVVFDVKVLQADNTFKWLTPDEVAAFCQERSFEHVPILYKGKYYRETAYSFTKGASKYCASQKVREGVVIKDATNYDFGGNKRALKWVSEDYLDDHSNTDNH